MYFDDVPQQIIAGSKFVEVSSLIYWQFNFTQASFESLSISIVPPSLVTIADTGASLLIL
jgi:hypothetical protein